MIGTACPDFDRLLRFLEGPSPKVEDEALVSHVEGCAACRAELERLAAATELPALNAARAGREASADVSYLRRLKELDLRRMCDSPAPPRPGEAPLPEIAGDALLGELGRGGAGAVFHARPVGGAGRATPDMGRGLG
jgi:hypothetical protein